MYINGTYREREGNFLQRAQKFMGSDVQFSVLATETETKYILIMRRGFRVPEVDHIIITKPSIHFRKLGENVYLNMSINISCIKIK